AQVSPFLFQATGEGAHEAWNTPLRYPAIPPPPMALTDQEITNRVRAGLAQPGHEPEVAELFLLDAELALYEGRFREAVLFCWSTIDSVFNRKYDALVEVILAGEWVAAREFFTGPDFGLRNKMSAAMHLLAQRSLFREPGELWSHLTVSYNKRNAIIH